MYTQNDNTRQLNSVIINNTIPHTTPNFNPQWQNQRTHSLDKSQLIQLQNLLFNLLNQLQSHQPKFNTTQCLSPTTNTNTNGLNQNLNQTVPPFSANTQLNDLQTLGLYQYWSNTVLPGQSLNFGADTIETQWGFSGSSGELASFTDWAKENNYLISRPHAVPADLQQAEQQWAQNNTGNYDFRYSIDQNAVDADREIEIQVRDNQVINAFYTDTNETAPPQRQVTIDDLLVDIDNAYGQNYSVNAQYDTTTGAPTQFKVELNSGIIGADYSYNINSLRQYAA